MAPEPVRETAQEIVEPVSERIETALATSVPALVPSEPVAPPPPQEIIEPKSVTDLKLAPVPQTLTIARTSEPTHPKKSGHTPRPKAKEPRRQSPSQTGNGGNNNADSVAAPASAGQRSNSGSGGEAELARYPSQVLGKLRRALRYPGNAGGASGEVHVHFTVAANGQPSGLRIARSSGNATIDQAGLDTVGRAAPFPPIPPGANRSNWAFTVPLAFER